ncbi:39S ribosomal protein L4, mitochondrial [Hypsibius exemplaris]|uniref:Large ribosomal subunit protein uL4m n=1 Tax=Hypsibius exemplaris TaxID=2072580 RepID=A0A1W0WTG5_HYPEX|nr:39S ribosomal protein L4, mitochondrial [Hypsibius exemplaris]
MIIRPVLLKEPSPKVMMHKTGTLLRTVFSRSWLAESIRKPALLPCAGTISRYTASSSSNSALITDRQLLYPPKYNTPREAWVETLGTLEGRKVGLIPLHPDIFAEFPRIDVIHENVKWQKLYQHVDYAHQRTRAEMPGGGRKPWPQKKTGRARHGSIRSPLFKGGGAAKGPRGPKSFFYMLDLQNRAKGLKCTLSAKFAQDDLHIVDSFESLSSPESQFLEALAAKRNWGLSVLFVDDTDFMAKNIALACRGLPSFTLMPVYGLNCFSMLKHETVVLTTRAVDKIEERLKRVDNLLRQNDPRHAR